jgi:hypothetical protein
MKPTLMALLAIGLLAGCSKTIEEKNVVGTYERREGGTVYTLMFRENGVVEEHENGRLTVEAKWTIKSGEIELFLILNGNKNYYKIEPDFSLSLIAIEILGKQKEAWEGKEITFKKIK